ncbi:MAG: hypothetical protein II393_03795, partial [Cytophagales bacterium]|nr:hypothetical protein [Cytophagales bacterium]
MRNIEALKNYFLGKDPQLKETMADNSLRLIGIPGREFVLRAELLRRLKALKDELSLKDKELEEAIESLENWKETTDFVDTSFLAATLEQYYTKSQVDELIQTLPHFVVEVVETLPTEDISTTTIYLVPSSNPEVPNYYDEYIYVNNQWEQIGTTAIDLSDYYTKIETDIRLDANVKHIKQSKAASTLALGLHVSDGAYSITSLQSTIMLKEGDLVVVSKGAGLITKILTVIKPGGITVGTVNSQGNMQIKNYLYVSNAESTDNKTDTIDSSSTNTQYPSAAAVYNAIQGSATTDYEDLSNKPSINNVTLSGNKTGSDLGLGDVPVGTVVQFDGNTIPVGYEEVNGLETYSTTEQVVGTWIDGKPLYQRVASITMDHTGNVGGYNLGDLVANNIEYGTIVGVFTTG